MFDQSTSEESSHHKWLILIIILMAPFMAYLDLYIVFVASPSIQHGLHTNFEQIQFVIAGYTIAYGVNLITAGRLGDTYGRKRMFMTGMAVFTLTSAGCAFAPNSLTLIIIRIFQGAAAAIMFPQTLAIIQATFTSKQKDIAIAWYGVIIGFGAVAGQLLGGFLVQTNLFNLDWRLIFLVNVPIGIGTLIAASRIVHESKSEKSVGLDIGGTAIISVILFLLFYPLIEGRDAGWPLWMYISVILSIVLIVPFIFFERRLTSSSKLNGSGNMDSKNDKRSQSTFKPKLPLIPLSLFKDRSFMIGTLLMLVFYIGNFVFVFVLTFYLQNGLGYSPLASGLIYLPMGFGFLISSLLTPKIVPKLETGILKIGTIIMIVGYGLVVITAHQESSIGLQSSQLLPYMFTIGIGLGFVVVPLINIIISRTKVENVGAASGVLNTMMAVGNAMGIALIGSLFIGMIAFSATSASDIGNDFNGSINHVKIHQYTYALINSILRSIGVVIVTFLLIFLLPSMRHKEQSSEQKNHGSVST